MMRSRGSSARIRFTTNARRAVLLTLVALIAAVLIAPAAALATVQPFAATMPGGSGTGGGVGEVWPIGFGFVTDQNGPLWGDDTGDTYQALTRDTTYISGQDPLGGPQRLLAFVNKNPNINKPYIKLKKNGVYVAGLEGNIQSPNRNAAIIVPDYLSEYPILYPGLPQNNAWFIPINAVTLDPGCAYEFSFLCGITANNAMTGVIYTDTDGNKLGYIQHNTSPSFPDENDQYVAKQYDTYLFRNAGPEVLDENKRFEPFLFRFQTYSDTTAFETALAAAQSALTTATANMGTGPGQVDPARVAVLSSAVTSAAGVPLDTMRERLQPDVDEAVNVLDAAVAQAQVLNPPVGPEPVTSVAGIPSGWATGSVTFSLEVSGESPPFTSSYSLNGGRLEIYSSPVTVSGEGITTLSYHSVDASGHIEAAQSATVRIDGGKPSTTFTRLPADEPAIGPVIFTLAAADPVSGVASVRYAVDGAEPASTYHAPVAVAGFGAHSVTYWAIDVAGNVEDAHTATFTIAPAPPYTNKSGLPISWSNTPETFTFSVTGDAPPFTTYYHLDGGPPILYAGPATISTEGTTTVEYYSIDSLGQTETVRTALARIDTIAASSAIGGVADGGTYSGPVSFTLSATDAGSGVSEITYSLDGGGSVTYSSPVSVTGTGSHTLSWHAVDVAGNVESTHTASFVIAASTRFEQSDARLAYASTWSTATAAAFSGNSLKLSSVAGAEMTAAFDGTSVSWVALTGRNYGIARVTIDGGAPETVDLYTAAYAYRQAVFTRSGLAPGAHTLRIEWTGTKNASATGYSVNIDAIEVAGTLTQAAAYPARFEQTDSRLAFTPAWSSASGSGFSGTSLKLASTPGSEMTAAFEGTSVSWIALTGRNYGIARVSVDGGAPETVDLYSLAYAYRQAVFVRSGLAPGAHTLRIEFTGTRNASATGASVNIDAIDVAGTLVQAPAYATRFEETDTRLAFTGPWSPASGSGYSGTHMNLASAAGADLLATFTGTSVRWIALKGRNYGIARVTVDGGAPEMVDLYSADFAFQQVAWSRSGLTEGPHTLRIEFTGTRNAAATGYSIDVDAIDVIGTLDPARPRFEETDPKIAYGGVWTPATGASYSANWIRYASASGAQFSADFTGTSVRWIALVGRNYGIARVTLDGGAPQLVDLYAPDYAFKQVVFDRSGLAPGSHTLLVEFTGTKNAAATGASINIDAIDVIGTLVP